MSEQKPIELYYWGARQFAGRGEFVRLVLSVCDLPWVDVAFDQKNPGAPIRYFALYNGKPNEKFEAKDEFPVSLKYIA